MKNSFKLIVSFVISFGAAAIGSVFTSRSIPDWYETLISPSFAPPNWVFAPVWTILYALMAVAFFLVWRQGLRDGFSRLAIGAFVVQLALNALWSYLFFGAQNIGLALVEICFLWFAILLTAALFWKLNRVSAWLLLPYLLWVTFAAVLNFSFFLLN